MAVRAGAARRLRRAREALDSKTIDLMQNAIRYEGLLRDSGSGATAQLLESAREYVRALNRLERVRK